MTGRDPSSQAGESVKRSCLAKLIEFGLSDAHIEDCFSLPAGEAQRLRERYNLASATGHTFIDAQSDPVIAAAMSEFSNGLQAAVTYAGSAIKCANRDGAAATTSMILMERTLEQLLRVGRAYQSLQRRTNTETK